MSTPILRYQLELTDTFGGEANYSWVNREEINVNANYSRSWIVRKAKEAMGLTGMRGETEDTGYYIRVDFPNYNQVLFITLIS